MSDSYGDGWSGNTISVGNQSATLEDGFEGATAFCLDMTTCHEYTVGGGSWASEISWSIADVEGAGAGSGLIGTCVTGCGDENAENYDADADIIDNTLCEYALVQGVWMRLHATMMQQLSKITVHVNTQKKVLTVQVHVLLEHLLP